MKILRINFLVACIAMLFFSCTKEQFELDLSTSSEASQPELSAKNGATQISGIGYFAVQAQCDYVAQGADYALEITGDLSGCLYVYVDDYDCSPSGTYRESGREYFVGTYDGGSGTFWTDYRFEGKYEGCDNGFFVGAEIFGRCQHKIQDDSGTGVFDDVSGRINFKDNVVTGALPYKGHLKF